MAAVPPNDNKDGKSGPVLDLYECLTRVDPNLVYNPDTDFSDDAWYKDFLVKLIPVAEQKNLEEVQVIFKNRNNLVKAREICDIVTKSNINYAFIYRRNDLKIYKAYCGQALRTIFSYSIQLSEKDPTFSPDSVQQMWQAYDKEALKHIQNPEKYEVYRYIQNVCAKQENFEAIQTIINNIPKRKQFLEKREKILKDISAFLKKHKYNFRDFSKFFKKTKGISHWYIHKSFLRKYMKYMKFLKMNRGVWESLKKYRNDRGQLDEKGELNELFKKNNNIHGENIFFKRHNVEELRDKHTIYSPGECHTLASNLGWMIAHIKKRNNFIIISDVISKDNRFSTTYPTKFSPFVMEICIALKSGYELKRINNKVTLSPSQYFDPSACVTNGEEGNGVNPSEKDVSEILARLESCYATCSGKNFAFNLRDGSRIYDEKENAELNNVNYNVPLYNSLFQTLPLELKNFDIKFMNKFENAVMPKEVLEKEIVKKLCELSLNGDVGALKEELNKYSPDQAKKLLNNQVYHTKRWTPLHYACAKGHKECIIFLMKAGADADLKNSNDKKPFDYYPELEQQQNLAPANRIVPNQPYPKSAANYSRKFPEASDDSVSKSPFQSMLHQYDSKPFSHIQQQKYKRGAKRFSPIQQPKRGSNRGKKKQKHQSINKK